jgi:NAD(P)-dependent dehydrogenase (short-subunit alcohol dehydrogenase family)
MSEPFDGKVAIVTGAAGGMGRAIVLAFAGAGASVVAADISENELAETTRQATEAGGGVRAITTDVGSAADIQAMVNAAVDDFGGLDCAVNAAAIEIETTPLVDCEEEVFDKLVRVNLKSVFLSMKYELRVLIDQGRGGAIVNIASTNSFRPQPGQSCYTATKHGVIGLTRNAAMAAARDGIRINAICPGAIDTPMLRGSMERKGRSIDDITDRLSLMGRIGQPDEIARAALWLCSDESSYTVGHALAVDGGYLAR